MTQIEQPFEELLIPHRELHDVSATHYRVYRDIKSYKLVEAVSALDALMRSGVGKAYKIERYNPLAENIIQLGQVAGISDNSGSDEAIIAPEIEEVIAADDHETIEVSIGDSKDNSGETAALNNDEIDKLLNG